MEGYSPIFVLAEVMDKEPSLAALWIRGLGIGLLGIVAARWRRWAVAPFFGLSLLFCFGITDAVFDPFVGPAIRSEAGQGYVVGAIAAGLASLVLPAGGLLIARRPRARNARGVPRET